MTSSMPRTTGSTFKLSHILIWAVLIGAYIWFLRPAQPLPGWENNFQSAQKEAADDRKPMMLAFYMDGCGPCVAMDRKVLPQSQVVQALEPFVTVRLDATRERELANRYSVYGTPTYAVIKANGQLVSKCQGYQTTDEFIAFIDRATQRLATPQPTEAVQLDAPSTTAP